MPNLIKKVQNTIFEQSLFPHGSKIIIACSGGPDSTVLLDIFSKLQKKYSLKLSINHVNYNLRQKDSKKDEVMVKKLAVKYSLDLKILNVDLKNQFSEESLREIRYSFFEENRKKSNFDYIAVGHTLDDQVETFLMRVIRGSGLSGLSSISYKNNYIIRPLLNIAKIEILKYLKDKKLSYRIDKTNLESKFFRNKIRNQLIPYLEKYNPKVKQTIFGSTESIRDDYNFIKYCAKKEFLKSKKLLSVKKLISLHPSIRKQILLLAIQEKKSNLLDIEHSHIKELEKIIKSTKNKAQVVVLKGLKITRKGDNITIENN